MIKDIATVSIDMSTCDFDADHRIFAKSVEFVNDTNTLICEFESANYEYENTNPSSTISNTSDKFYQAPYLANTEILKDDFTSLYFLLIAGIRYFVKSLMKLS